MGVFIKECAMDYKSGTNENMKNIELNNAQDVLDYFSSEDSVNTNGFLTMVQGNTYSDVEITDDNIKNNSSFVMSIWD